MKARVWLIFDKSGVDRMLKRAPESLARGEKSAIVDILIDDLIFAPPPKLQATLELKGSEMQEGTQVVLDPSANTPRSDRGDYAQSMMNHMAAELLQKSINSTDRGVKEFAINALAICKEAGVIVKIVVPDEPALPTQGGEK